MFAPILYRITPRILASPSTFTRIDPEPYEAFVRAAVVSVLHRSASGVDHIGGHHASLVRCHEGDRPRRVVDTGSLLHHGEALDPGRDLLLGDTHPLGDHVHRALDRAAVKHRG